jgi:diaminopimelate decarboxylase
MNKDISLPFNNEQAENVAKKYGTPIYIYDEKGIRKNARDLKRAFAWAKQYKNYFAVKATPTPAILKILSEEGMGFDCSSRTELLMVKRIGIKGDDVFYTSNNTPKEDFELAIEMGATINIDDLAQIPVFAEVLKDRNIKRVALRYNPGKLKTGNNIIGEPTEAKYGMSLEQLIVAFGLLSKQNVSEFGLHTMVASNELNEQYFADTARVLRNASEKIEQSNKVKITFLNIGGGFGVNYRPEQKPLDINKTAKLIKKAFDGFDVQLLTEHGRFVTGPYGYLLTRARYVMQKYKNYIGVDASMHNLMRPGMYGAYHHISVLGKENMKPEKTYDVVGSLCENNDKFAVNRKLPVVVPGDLLVVHDSGAHGHAMGFNYNGFLRSAELLQAANGNFELIRRAESEQDYFRNIVWPQ